MDDDDKIPEGTFTWELNRLAEALHDLRSELLKALGIPRLLDWLVNRK